MFGNGLDDYYVKLFCKLFKIKQGMIFMMYTTKLFFTSKNGLVYSYDMETFGNNIESVVAKVREHVYMFKKTARVNVGIYDDNDNLKACWTSEDKLWVYPDNE